jgi:hypothetical protein
MQALFLISSAAAARPRPNRMNNASNGIPAKDSNLSLLAITLHSNFYR